MAARAACSQRHDLHARAAHSYQKFAPGVWDRSLRSLWKVAGVLVLLLANRWATAVQRLGTVLGMWRVLTSQRTFSTASLGTQERDAPARSE